MRPILLIIFLFIVNCKFDKVVDSHGVHYLVEKQKKQRGGLKQLKWKK